MTDKPVEHAWNPYGNFCAECEEPWPCEVTRLRAALNEALAQNERFNTRYRDSEAENERLRVEIELLRQHDKLVTDLTIDQQLEIERLRAGAQG